MILFESLSSRMISIRSLFVLGNSWIVLYLLCQQAKYAEGRDPKAWNKCENSELECKYRNPYDGVMTVSCFQKSEFCQGTKNCYDNLNKRYCAIQQNVTCPSMPYRWVKCADGTRCIPKIWWGDGKKDCLDGSDEENYSENILEKVNGSGLARERAVEWLLNQRKASNYRNAKNIGNWGPELPRIAVALALANSTFFSPGNAIGEEITSELKIQILDELLSSTSRERDTITTMSSNKLAIYIQAMIVTCLDPRYFHKIDLVKVLRDRVNSMYRYTNPFLLLTLCKAKDYAYDRDVLKLRNFVNFSDKHFWTDTQAMALMALTCFNEQSPVNYDYDSNLIFELASQLKKLQSRNGTIQSLPTTALVMQGLFASGEEENYRDPVFKWEESIKYLISSQSSDGSYGTLLNMYHVLPVLSYKSLKDINTKHCIFNESTIDIKYTLKFGEDKDLTRSLELTVAKSNFFEIMKVAATVDLKYRFKYGTSRDLKSPHVYEVAGVQEDPENDKFWYLYKIDKYGKYTTLIESSPIDVIPTENEEYIMWYRSGEVRQ